MREKGFYELPPFTNLFELPFICLAGNFNHMTKHWHDEVELLCPIIGGLAIRMGDEKIALEPGDIYFINSCQSHEIFSDGELAVNLMLRFDRRFYKNLGDRRIVIPTDPANEDRGEIVRCMFELAELYNKFVFNKNHTDDDWYLLRILMYKLLRITMRYTQAPREETDHTTSSANLNMCIDIINKRYSEPLSAKIIGDEIGVSGTTIYQLIKRYMGISLGDYLRSVRITAACGMLGNSEIQIGNVALACGFGSLSNFYHTFNSITGMSPGEYRQVVSRFEIDGTHASKNIQETMVDASFQPHVAQLNQWKHIAQMPYTYEQLAQVVKNL